MALCASSAGIRLWSTPGARRSSSRMSRKCSARTPASRTRWSWAGRASGGVKRSLPSLRRSRIAPTSRMRCYTPIAGRILRDSKCRSSLSTSSRSVASATARRTIAGRKTWHSNGRRCRRRDDMTHDVIDCLVNVHFGESEKQPTWMLKVRDDYFKGPESMFAPVDMSELLDEMDEQGVRRAVLMDSVAKPSTTARKFVEARPDRFSLAMGGVNLLKPMPSLRELSAVVNDLPVAYTVVGPSFWGDGQYPPSDAVYYPLYTKCAEMELPLCINTGLPGPPIPGEVQNPIHLDRVCVRFPELKLCMIHGADPWWDIAIRLMIKYQNLRLMTSAWSPKRLPESLLHYMRTRGKNKVLFASDYPVLSFARTLGEAAALDLAADVLENYLYNNAHTFFFEGQEEH